MRISMMADPWAATVPDMIEESAFAGEIGADTYWIAQIWRTDSMTLIPTLAAGSGTNLKFGSGIVCSYLRHPVTLASQALTTNLLVDGRYTLGVGTSHEVILQPMFEIAFDGAVRHMREYLDVLLPALEQRPVDADGETVSFHGTIDVPGAPPPQVVLAALGPRMLRLCGARTAGTITWMTGPRTLAEYVVPTLRAAAGDAAASPSRVIALVPMVVTDDVDAARRQAAEQLGIYGISPSYRAMLDREGWGAPEDAALIGSEDDVREQLARYDQEGVTEVGIQILGPRQGHSRTRALIADLCRASAVAA